MKQSIKNKKILLMGLGILGGGVATAKWLLRHGAILTITDKESKQLFTQSIKQVSQVSKKVKYVLGGYHKSDFLDNDIIVANPAVPKNDPFLRYALQVGKQVENELTLFFKYQRPKKVVAVTGTRGKTTTTNWIAHLLKLKYPDIQIGGNSPDKPLLASDKKPSCMIVEMPSFLLEHFVGLAPDIAVITNIYQDHLNRYEGIKDYARTKANIFLFQTSRQKLILNRDNSWTSFFLKLTRQSKVLFFSKSKPLLHQKDIATFIAKWGEHNLENLYAAIMAAKAAGASQRQILKMVPSLPGIKFRQELVYKKNNLEIYNDSAATSPEATVAAAKRFQSENTVLITGGTDRNLDFVTWSKEIKKILKPGQFIFLSGSATNKMIKGLKYKKKELKVFETLEECLRQALLRINQNEGEIHRVIFSPGAKSFEKFKNEFDRGAQFNNLVKKLL